MSVRQYHNLEGWLRDVAAAMQEYETDPGGVGTSAFCRLLDVLRDCEEMVDADDDPDDTADDGEADVDGDDASLREDDAPRARRPASRREALSPATSGLGRELADVPGTVRGQTEPVQCDLWGGTVGAPCGVMRTAPPPKVSTGTYAPQETRSVPRGTPQPERTPTRKGVSRGKKRTTKRRAKR